MQTFLPFAEFSSVKLLDTKRHGKQRSEAMTIWKILTKQVDGGSWKKHPAVIMWSGYEDALALYYNTTIATWMEKGYTNNMPFIQVTGRVEMPWWLGYKDFHSSHRAALLYKDFDYYYEHGWEERPEINYCWPVGK